MKTSRPGRVVVIGNCTLDSSFRLPRFPFPGETMLTDEHSLDVGGKGANQAVAAARNGVEVELCAVVGDDDHGRMIVTQLAAEGVDVRRVRAMAGSTDESIIYVTGDGENSIVSTYAAASSMRQQDVTDSLRDATEGDVVLMQGNLVRDLTRFALRQAQAKGVATVLNPAPINYDYDGIWPFVDYAILNAIETEQLTGHVEAEKGARWLLDQGVGQVVITLGQKGAILVSGEKAETIAADEVDAVDTTGAGDVFCGTFAAGLARSAPLLTTVIAAVRAATLSVTRSGTQSAFPTRVELDRIAAGAQVSRPAQADA